ncbi:UNVERIFIED_CONTAM: hypothetical protein FKN15_066846 [Acipenser sinensis]
MNTRCPPKRVPSAARFFTLCRLTMQPPQSYSVGGQRSSGQLTGKPASVQPDYRGRWCPVKYLAQGYSSSLSHLGLNPTTLRSGVQSPNHYSILLPWAAYRQARRCSASLQGSLVCGEIARDRREGEVVRELLETDSWY